MIRVGDRVKVQDPQSEFYGLTLVVARIRTESNPRPFQTYLCKTLNGLAPEGYPFSSKGFRQDQIKPL